MSVIEAQLGYTPRGSRSVVELSPSKVPPVFKRGAPVPWTPRGQATCTEHTSSEASRSKIVEEGRDLSLEGGRSKTIEDTNGDGPPGVLANIDGAESVDLSLRAGSMRPVTEHSAADPEIAVRLQEVLVQHDGGQGDVASHEQHPAHHTFARVLFDMSTPAAGA